MWFGFLVNSRGAKAVRVVDGIGLDRSCPTGVPIGNLMTSIRKRITKRTVLSGTNPRTADLTGVADHLWPASYASGTEPFSGVQRRSAGIYVG